MHRHFWIALPLLTSFLYADQPQDIEEAGYRGYISGDFLYWTAREEGLEFAYDGAAGTASTPPATSVEGTGQVFFPDWQWGPGFRIAVGVYSEGWDLSATYTRFLTTAHGLALAGDTQLKRYWQLQSFSPTTLLLASTSWDIDVDTVDLALGKRLHFGRKWMFHPYGGLKGTWQMQRYQIQYTADTASARMVQTQHLSGVGIRGGCNGSWDILSWLGIYGEFAASLLWQRFDVHRTDTNIVGEDEIVSLRLERDFSTAQPMIEAALGLQAGGRIGKRCFLTVRTAYEYQMWFQYNQFVRLVMDTGGSGGYLSLQGLSVRATLDF